MDNKKKKIITGVSIIALLIAFGIGMFVIGGNESEDVSAKDDKKMVKEEKSSVEKEDTENKDAAAKEVDKNDNSTNSSTKEKTSNKSSSNDNKTNSSSKHKHSWVAQYEKQDNGYYEYVYETVYYSTCNKCGKDITGVEAEHSKNVCLSGHTDRAKDILVDTIWHSDIQKVYIGDKCSSCGEWR